MTANRKSIGEFEDDLHTVDECYFSEANCGLNLNECSSSDQTELMFFDFVEPFRSVSDCLN